MKTVEDIRESVNRYKAKREVYQQAIKDSKRKLRLLKRQLTQFEEAKEVIRLVGAKTQEQLQYHIGDITSMALDSVFTDPYKLEMEFVQRRNKTECDLFFSRKWNRVNPLSSSGGGAVDIAAFALRIASWSLQNPKTRPVIVLDEPMRFVSEDYKDKASAMLKEVSRRLGIQFLIVTHEPKLTAYADKVFEVKIKKGVSQVEVS